MTKIRPRKYAEKDFQADFGRWVRGSGVISRSAAFELKVVDGERIPYDAVVEHQIDALLASQRGKLFWKIPDDSLSAKPFDCFLLTAAEAWVVVMFLAQQRGRRRFTMIGAGLWDQARRHADKKSITMEEAESIGLTYELS